MDNKQLIKFFSDFWKIDASQINENLRFDSLELDFDSLRFYQFIAALESNFNVTVGKINELHTFKDLQENIK